MLVIPPASAKISVMHGIPAPGPVSSYAAMPLCWLVLEAGNEGESEREEKSKVAMTLSSAFLPVNEDPSFDLSDFQAILRGEGILLSLHWL